MPPPIVPAPTTAARLMSLAGVSLGTSGTFATSRSAKNRWRSALDSVDTTQSANNSRSRVDPSSKGCRRPASMAPTAAYGAICPFASLASAARAGDDSQQHFGLPDARICRCNPEVTRLSDFEAAAERVAVNRGDQRLGRVLDSLQQRVRTRRSRQRVLAGLQGVEDLDIRAG